MMKQTRKVLNKVQKLEKQGTAAAAAQKPLGQNFVNHQSIGQQIKTSSKSTMLNKMKLKMIKSQNKWLRQYNSMFEKNVQMKEWNSVISKAFEIAEQIIFKNQLKPKQTQLYKHTQQRNNYMNVTSMTAINNIMARSYTTTSEDANMEKLRKENINSFFETEDGEDYIPKRSKNSRIFHQKIVLGLVVFLVLASLYDMVANFSDYYQQFVTFMSKYEAAMTNDHGYLLDYESKEKMERPTLVLNPDIVFFTKYDIQSGTSYQLRPDAISFLEKIAQYYEIILFFDEYKAGVQVPYEALRKMCLGARFGQPLSRESTDWDGGMMTKDMRKLGRDPDSILHVDCRKESFGRTPEYGLYVSKFEGDNSDKQLKELYPLIANLAIEWYDSFTNPESRYNPELQFDFRKRLRQLGHQGRSEKDEYGRLTKVEGIPSFNEVRDKYFAEIDENEGKPAAKAEAEKKRGWWGLW